MIDVAGKVAIITGGVRGIGFGIARAFADAGMKLILTYRREDSHRDAMAYFQSRPDVDVHAIRLDVTDRVAVARAAEEVSQRFGKVHVLCNNAGVSSMGSLDTATYADWDWILSVNLNGIVNTLMEFVPLIKAHGEGGHIVNVASMSSFITGANAGVYATSKFAVRGLTEGLRYSLAPHRIGVSMMCPGLTRTDIYRSPWERTAGAVAAADEAFLKRLEGIHALGMDPLEVGRKTLAGLRQGDFYIFTHPEFKDELREICDEILAALPAGECAEPGRLAFEEKRRRMKDQGRLAVSRLREQKS